MQKEALQRVYQDHHERGDRYGYLYCHGARSPYLKDWIGQGGQVLDLGCRDGMLTEAFTAGNQVTGVDIDQKALALVQKRLDIETRWLDLNHEWPFQKESFDVVVACEILEHLFLLEPMLTQIAATLRPGGTFIGSVPNSFRFRNRLKFLFGQEFDKDPTHMRRFSYSKLEDLLGTLFTDIEIVPLGGKIAPFIPVSVNAPQSLNRLFAKDLLWRCKKRSLG